MSNKECPISKLCVAPGGGLCYYRSIVLFALIPSANHHLDIGHSLLDIGHFLSSSYRIVKKINI